ncbi:NAD(P)/FAD-dependent oxidoreductase [Thermocatellispora tengchongensis]|uniref:NAD(P)/FAD-dependent oxidoreductase n=1 Tax=Thermocatellispora tengchongensis TaxID=1073253 RepID=UPI0036394F78
MPAPREHVVVVGAGLGGVRTAENLRSRGYLGRITLVGAEPHPPYDRPPLSKQILTGAWEPDRAVLRDKPGLDEIGVSARLGAAAVALHGTTVELEDGARITGDAVVLATGVAARRLPGQPDGVATLRGLDDALALRDALAEARSLLVVGAGFIGAEAAHAARLRGLEVIVLEAGRVPCERALGPLVGELAARLFREAGADLRCGAGIARFTDARTVELADGTTVSADVALAGVGAAPALTWLDGSGLDTAGGVACDAGGRASGADDVWALGDMAAWWDPVRRRRHRAEHWTSAVDQAAAVACAITGAEPPPRRCPTSGPTSSA